MQQHGWTLSAVKSDRGRQTPDDITYLWNLNSDTNKVIYKTETDSDTENKAMVTKGERDSGERDKPGARD